MSVTVVRVQIVQYQIVAIIIIIILNPSLHCPRPYRLNNSEQMLLRFKGLAFT